MSMTAAERRALYRQQSEQRHQESYNNRDSSGQFKDFYEPAKKSAVKFWKSKEGEHDIIMVQTLTGKNHPSLSPDQMIHELPVFVHRQIGLNKDQFVCLNRTYGKPCPICEHLASFVDPSEATVKAYAPSKRMLYNVIVCDNATEEAQGVRVWEVSAKLFSKPLEDYSHKKREGGEVRYADIDNGKVVNFVQAGQKLSLEFNSFEFKKRRPITDEELESAAILDELIHIPTYDEVNTALKSGLEAKGETRTEPKKDNPAPEHAEEAKKEPEPAPAQAEDAPNFDPPVSDEECPFGAAYGKDFDEYEECKDCPKKDSCAAKKAELEKPKAPAKTRLTRRER
jgi:hypothetical protein